MMMNPLQRLIFRWARMKRGIVIWLGFRATGGWSLNIFSPFRKHPKVVWCIGWLKVVLALIGHNILRNCLAPSYFIPRFTQEQHQISIHFLPRRHCTSNWSRWSVWARWDRSVCPLPFASLVPTHFGLATMREASSRLSIGYYCNVLKNVAHALHCFCINTLHTPHSYKTPSTQD